MTRKLFFVLAAILASVALVGCGGDDDGDAAPTVPDVQLTTSDEPDVTIETESETTVDTPDADAAVQQAIESCKQSVQAAAGLSDDVKGDLDEICEKAASGDAEAVKEASIEVCRKIIEANVPAGDARDQAMAACNQSVTP